MAMESWVYLGGWSDLRLLYGKEVVSCSLILLEENVPAVVLLGVQPEYPRIFRCHNLLGRGENIEEIELTNIDFLVLINASTAP